jgi:hypothetical protein
MNRQPICFREPGDFQSFIQSYTVRLTAHLPLRGKTPDFLRISEGMFKDRQAGSPQTVIVGQK